MGAGGRPLPAVTATAPWAGIAAGVTGPFRVPQSLRGPDAGTAGKVLEPCGIAPSAHNIFKKYKQVIHRSKVLSKNGIFLGNKRLLTNKLLINK
jgi:hypothetical protein